MDDSSFQTLKSTALELEKAHKGHQRYEYYQKMIEELLNTQDVS